MNISRLVARHLATAAAVTVILVSGDVARGAQITFTGGTVVRHSGPNQTTNNSVLWSDVDYYEEAGFKIDFIMSGAPSPGASYIGNYYGAAQNDVIHGHWEAGGIGNLVRIVVTKLDNTAFDLNYFVLTSNTDQGGGPANGTELAYIHASGDGIADDFSMQLPVENWGFPATQIFLGSEFDSIKAFWFDVNSDVDCFGMDNFFINEPAPAVPVPGTAVLACLGAASLVGYRRRLRKAGN